MTVTIIESPTSGCHQYFHQIYEEVKLFYSFIRLLSTLMEFLQFGFCFGVSICRLTFKFCCRTTCSWQRILLEGKIWLWGPGFDLNYFGLINSRIGFVTWWIRDRICRITSPFWIHGILVTCCNLQHQMLNLKRCYSNISNLSITDVLSRGALVPAFVR